MGSKFKLALIQLTVGGNKVENLARAVLKISEAVENGAQIVSLPGNQLFKPTF
jgi:predicted amidohydrolase